jgi:hypothetical protein
MKLTLNLNDLAVESFEASVAGDPSQWGLMAPPPSDDTECEDCDALAAAPPEHTCTTTTRL